jgi:hypothetical protein
VYLSLEAKQHLIRTFRGASGRETKFVSFKAL